MYRLPEGSGGAEALSINVPTPTFLSVELSYIDTRHVTGVVPSGNSSGSSAARILKKKMIRTLKLLKEVWVWMKQTTLPSPSWQQSVYWLGIGKAKDRPYILYTSTSIGQYKNMQILINKIFWLQKFPCTYRVEQSVYSSIFVINSRESWPKQCIYSYKSS